ncbi:MAG TPA: CDP-alcohol phosphatidyltransferase family protein [Mycobacteriales bacterium]|jgi:phosphatidylglycerophosphate synthase|nr:CDP-alcohol phosphatidyltransferase family protein [Mycobacteriales bacterium]
MPSVAEVRAVGQPGSVLGRVEAETWAGRLYMRRVSPYFTRLLIPTRITANGVTWLMVVSGIAAAAALTITGLTGAVLAMLLVQLQLLLDCSDGEIARWRQATSPMGIYLDRIGHFVTEAALPIALGIRADGGWGEIAGWTTVGLLVAVLVLLVKSESDLVHVARAFAGRPRLDYDTEAAPRHSGMAGVRRLMRLAPFYRAFVTMEFSLLAGAAALVDRQAGDLAGSRGLLLFLVAAVGVTVVGHLLSIIASSRLR